MRKLLNLTCSLLLAVTLHAQSVTIMGQVVDTSERKPLANAVIALLTKDSVLLQHTRTDASGKFSITSNRGKPHLLMVTYPKFADFVDQVSEASPELDLGRINLIKKSVLLEEVIVSQKIGAIRMKGDTLEFKADSFAVREGANVEELLKKLPGLQVNKKGEITAQGEKVQKVLVDGEEFFSDDPAVVTQNLRADAIDKVQVFDKKSDQAAFTGIDDGEKQKTINLSLKEDRKKGYFGKAKIAGGLPSSYENEAMVNMFKGKRKAAVYGTMANTGKAGLNWEDNNKFGGGSNMEFNEEEGYFFSYNESDEFNTWGGTYRGEGLPKAWTAGAHFSNKWSNDNKHINGNYQFYKQDINNEGTTTTQYIFPDTLYYTKDLRKTFTQNTRHQLSGFYDLKLDSFQNVKITVKGSQASAQNESDFLQQSLNEEGQMVNNTRRSLYSTGEKQLMSVNAIWRKRFAKKGRTMSVSFDQKYNSNETNGLLKAINNDYDFTGGLSRSDTTDQKKDNYQQSNVLGGKISYTEPLSKKWFVELNYGYRLNNSKALRSSYNKNESGGKYDQLDSLYSNNYSYDFNTHSGGLNFRFNSDKINATVGSNITNARFLQEDLVRDSTTRYNFVNFFPKANIRFKMGAQRGLTVNYNGSTRQPSIQQIQPVVDNTDTRNIQLGNPDLKQEFRHSINAFYNDYKVLNGRNLYFNGGLNLVDNAISQNVTDTAGKRYYRSVNVDGNMNYWIYTGYWRQFKKLKLNVNTGLNANGGKNNNFVNGQKNTSTYSTVGANFSLWKEKDKVYSLSLETSPSRTKSKSSINPDLITKYWTIDNEFSGSIYKLPYKLEANTNMTYSWRQKTDVFGEDRNVWLWNASLAKKFWKNNSGELRFSINDILNQNVGFRRNATSNIISENTYINLRRYWLLSFTWNFSRNPGSK